MTPDARVLLVTDDADLRTAAPFAFSSASDVKLAADAREGIEQMQHFVPACVVIDIRTGSAGGFALGRDMRADGRLSSVPILMLLERTQDAWLAKQAGAEEWLVRPFRSGEVAQKVGEMIAAATN